MEMLASQERTQNSSPEFLQTSPVYLKCSFLHFYFLAWSVAVKRIEDVYMTPEHQATTCLRFQKYRRTSDVEPRFHLKSTLAEAYVAWKLYRMEHRYNEWMYLSYTSGLGAYHTKRIKRHIGALPEIFGDYQDLTDSDSIIRYGLGDREFSCEPEGILTAKRGKHPNGIIADDILRDPEVKLDLTQLKKISEKYFEVVESMPKEELHLMGTPQDQEDLFYELEQLIDPTDQKTPLYNCSRRTAEVDPARQIPLWPGRFPWAELKRIQATIKQKAYNKEYLCMPVRSEDAFVSRGEYALIECLRLKNYDIYSPPKLKNRTVVGGWDLGKKRHPAHFTVYVADRRQKRLLQIHSHFFDHIDYTDQLAYITQALKAFGMDRVDFDNTRGELTIEMERGELPGEMNEVVFTAKNKFSMATELDKRIQGKTILLIKDERQKGHILSIDNDLQGPSTVEGHGDAFFSNLLAVNAYNESSGTLIWSPGE